MFFQRETQFSQESSGGLAGPPSPELMVAKVPNPGTEMAEKKQSINSKVSQMAWAPSEHIQQFASATCERKTSHLCSLMIGMIRNAQLLFWF